MPLKKRGLSRFYSSKSQSFSCLQDLMATPFGSSTLALSKDAHRHMHTARKRLRLRLSSGDAMSVGVCASASAPASPSSSSELCSLLHADSLTASGESATSHWGMGSEAADDIACDDGIACGDTDSNSAEVLSYHSPAATAALAGLPTAGYAALDGMRPRVMGARRVRRRSSTSSKCGWSVPDEPGVHLCAALELISLSAPASCAMAQAGME